MPLTRANHAKGFIPSPGALGLVTLKNLLEKGFEVTGFDKSDAVGGLWNFTEHQQTSVLESWCRL